MYTSAPSEQELAVAGLTAADLEGDAIEVWPDNERAYFLFCQMQTQWRVGMGGATGLDYGVMFHKMDRMGLELSDYEELEADVRIMEYSALETMSNKG